MDIKDRASSFTARGEADRPPVYDFESFGLGQMIESSRTLRQLGQGAASMEEASREIVDFFFDFFRVPATGEPACVLARCFKTHRFGDLPMHLREVAAAGMNGGHPSDAMPCLVLLATRGIRPEWNSRHKSAQHKSIPLATAEMVEQAPMIARLVEQMGLRPHDVVRSSPGALTVLERQTLDVFHVEQARGSAFVPAQAHFVVPCGVRSVLGFGGVLPAGDLFFVLLFTRVPVTPETADLFRTLALGVKLVLLGHAGGQTFAR